MTVEEASHLYQLNEYEDLQEAYEFKVFELKQFLFTKIPFEQTYGSRLKQIDRLQEAYQLLGGEVKDDTVQFTFVPTRSTDLLDCWNRHQEIIRHWKLNVAKAESLPVLKELMGIRLKIYEWYARNWLLLMNNFPDEIDAKASVEYDPMELLNEIKAHSGDYEESELLLKESKRLNLWLNINGYE